MNPYVTPESGVSPLSIPDDKRTLRKALIQWEKLRILYNVILFVVGLTASKSVFFSQFESILFFAIFANCCYTIGPVLESYAIAFLGHPLGVGRFVLFGLGTLLSVFGIAAVGFGW